MLWLCEILKVPFNLFHEQTRYHTMTVWIFLLNFSWPIWPNQHQSCGSGLTNISISKYLRNLESQSFSSANATEYRDLVSFTTKSQRQFILAIRNLNTRNIHINNFEIFLYSKLELLTLIVVLLSINSMERSLLASKLANFLFIFQYFCQSSHGCSRNSVSHLFFADKFDDLFEEGNAIFDDTFKRIAPWKMETNLCRCPLSTPGGLQTAKETTFKLHLHCSATIF